MNNQNEKVKGRFHRKLGEPTLLDFGSRDLETQRFDLKASTAEAHKFVSRDLLSQFEDRFKEHMKSYENHVNYFTSELDKLSEVMNQVKENLSDLKLSVNENKLGLEHVAKDVELERFRSELEKVRRELESRLSQDFIETEKAITHKFNEKTRTSLAWFAALSGLIALIVSALIQILPLL